MLDCISFEPPEGTALLHGDRPPRLILIRCQGAWEVFKEFTHSIAHSAVVHTLVVIRSHYPSVKPEVIMTSFARGMSLAKITKLEDKVEEAAAKLAGDIDRFNVGGNNTE